MKSLIRILLFSMLIAINFVLVSCIGTIEEKNPEDAFGAESRTTNLLYPGVLKLKTISEKRILVTFPVALQNPASINYLVTVNNSENSFQLSPVSLDIIDGNYQYILGDLTAFTTYQVSVSLVDITTKIRSDIVNTLTATTFSNKTCDFQGVTSVIAPPGISGTSKIDIKWNKAPSEGVFFPILESDPVNYKVYYLDDNLGSREDLRELENTNIKVFTTTQTADAITIENLNSSNKYHVMIRCLHKGWNEHGGEPGYEKEENVVVLSVITSDIISNVTFGGSIETLTPDGSDGETSVDIRWTPASGNFSSYRIYYKKVGDPDGDAATLDTDQVGDDYIDGDPAATPTPILEGEYVSVFNTSLSTFRIDSLEPYSFYQFKVVACSPLADGETTGSACDIDHRVATSYKQKRIVPRLVPFAGIKYLGNPTGFYDCSFDTEKTCGSVFIHFDLIPLSLGMLTNLKVVCGSTVDFDVDSHQFALDGSSINQPGSVCHQLSMTNIISENFKSLTSLEVKDIIIGDDGKAFDRIFFKIIPYLTFDFNAATVYEAESVSAVVHSIHPEVRVPTGVEFTGLNSCSVDVINKTLTVGWNIPLGGNYEGFELFFRKENVGESFSFSAAMLAKNVDPDPDGGAMGDQSSEYKWIEAPFSKTTTTFTLDDSNTDAEFLIWGQAFELGILTSLKQGVGYSEPNSGIIKCKITIPGVKFSSWQNILSIGPKIDGTIPTTVNGDAAYTILETLNREYLPQEVIEPTITADLETYENYYPGEVNLRTPEHDATTGTTTGTPYGSEPNIKGNFSRNGIIHIAWKDAVLEGTVYTLSELIEDINNDGAVDDSESDTVKTGYQVFRSSDNGGTWTNLTDEDYDFSDTTRYLRAKPYFTNKKNNDVLVQEQIIRFTDYSVQHLVDENHQQRARGYLYKIKAFFRGEELVWSDDSIQNVIKVTLPPPNMALTHRLMANKEQCQMLGIVPGASDFEGYVVEDWDISKHYSCRFNGLGASSLGTPWLSGESVLDLGGDLLIDRFELACQFSRPTAKSSGCRPPAAPAPDLATSYLDYHQYQDGDCLGAGFVSLTNTDSCEPNTFYYTHTYSFPGAEDLSDFRGPLECKSSTEAGAELYNAVTFFDVKLDHYNNYAHRSDFGAVSYNRAVVAGWWTRSFREMYGTQQTGADDPTVISGGAYTSQCTMNISYDTDSEQDLPRWMSLDELGDRGVEFDSTVGELKNNTIFYDGITTVPAPVVGHSILDDDASIAQVMTSNSAKLPPLTGLSQAEAMKVCGGHFVAVGYKSDFGAFVTSEEVHNKRLLRKKEFIAAAAWNENFDSDRTAAQAQLDLPETVTRNSEANITDLESGAYTKTINGTSTRVGAHNGTTDSQINGYPLELGASAADNTYLSSTYIKSGSTVHIAGGSSYFDSFSFLRGTEGNPLLRVSPKTTERNVSRYGIQDMIGNVAEFSSERIFTNTDGFKTFINIAQDTAFEIASISTFYSTTAFPYGMTISAPEEGGEASPITEGVLDPLADNYVSPLDGTTILPSILSDGSLNAFFSLDLTDIIDPGGLDYLRNGDGAFLNFGNDQLLPSLKYNDVMSLQNPIADGTVGSRIVNYQGTDPRSYSYFSPVMGLPLNCGTGSCDSTQDNFRAKLYNYGMSGAAAGDAIIEGYKDIPINRSQIYNDGLGEQLKYYSYDVSSSAENLMPHTIPAILNDNMIDDPVAVNQKTGVGVGVLVPMPSLTSDGIADPDDGNGFHTGMTDFAFTVVNNQWYVHRGSPMYFVNGGSKLRGFSGRYSTRFTNRYYNADGVRCATLINKE